MFLKEKAGSVMLRLGRIGRFQMIDWVTNPRGTTFADERLAGRYEPFVRSHLVLLSAVSAFHVGRRDKA
jgi:hypothetical protein